MILQENYGLCLECNEGIFNPVCPYCLAEQMAAWIGESRLKKAEKAKAHSFLNSIKHEFGDAGVSCALCHDNQTEICPYCFTEKMYNFVVQFGIDKKTAQEFLTHFNYDFDHTGYEKDAEENY